MSLAVRPWTELEFAEGRQVWQQLLANSAADPLFMGWDWQWTWWQHHRDILSATLCLLAVTDASGQLVGLAPLYLRDARVKSLLPVRRLECLGSAWREKDTVFSEYFDIIADRNCSAGVASAIADWLARRRDWDDWAMSHVRSDALVTTLSAMLKNSGSQERKVEALPTHVINLKPGFKLWLDRLSSDARRRLHNHRSRLEQPQFRQIEPAEVSIQLERLQQWRAGRYRGGGAGHTVQEFEQALVARLAASGALRLTELSHRGQTLSIMLDVRLGGTEYYLASAFAPEVERGLTPGYLHFGYTIESACGSGVERFDLLAGRGKHRDYKSDLGGETLELRSMQLLRAPSLKFVNRIIGEF